MRTALGIEYDGSDFAGWQSQEGGLRIVQGSVEQALSTVADRPVRAVCAGRTDDGVHANAQGVHFDTDAERSLRAWQYGANANLPKGVSVQWWRVMDDAVHARFSAVRRRYRYVILNREVRPTFLAWRVAWEYRPLDAVRMQEAAQYLIGEHDFSAYRAVACQAKSPVRSLYQLIVTRDRDLVFLDLEANAFLHHMVRNIAGVLMDVGAGKRPPVWAREVLETRDRSLGGITAPPHGLYLTRVEICGITRPDDALAARRDDRRGAGRGAHAAALRHHRGSVRRRRPSGNTRGVAGGAAGHAAISRQREPVQLPSLWASLREGGPHARRRRSRRRRAEL